MTLDKESIQKLLEAGYQFIRKDNHPKPRIKVKQKGKDWTTLQPEFTSKESRDYHFNELRKISVVLTEQTK